MMDASEIEAQDLHDKRIKRLARERAKHVAVREWFRLHDAYHKASAVYNARLAFVGEQRALDNWEPTVHAEYRLLSDAQRAAIGAAETLYQKLAPLMALSSQEGTGTQRPDIGTR